jgi:hypothetical protein
MVILLTPPLEAHLDGAFGADINALHARCAFFEANPAHYELAPVYFLKLPWTHLGAKA